MISNDCLGLHARTKDMWCVSTVGCSIDSADRLNKNRTPFQEGLIGPSRSVCVMK